MRNLTRLLLLLVIAALGWGFYWYVGAQATERGLAAWLDARRGEGWTAEAATLARRSDLPELGARIGARRERYERGEPYRMDKFQLR